MESNLSYYPMPQSGRHRRLPCQGQTIHGYHGADARAAAGCSSKKWWWMGKARSGRKRPCGPLKSTTVALAVLEGTPSKEKKPPAGTLSVIPAGDFPESWIPLSKGTQAAPLFMMFVPRHSAGMGYTTPPTEMEAISSRGMISSSTSPLVQRETFAS